jgi:hypothetical protein
MRSVTTNDNKAIHDKPCKQMAIAMQNKEPISRGPRKYAASDDKEFISDRSSWMMRIWSLPGTAFSGIRKASPITG